MVLVRRSPCDSVPHTFALTSKPTARPTRSLELRLSYPFVRKIGNKLAGRHAFGHKYCVISFIIAQSAFRCSALETSPSERRAFCFDAWLEAAACGIFASVAGRSSSALVDLGSVVICSLLVLRVVENLRHAVRPGNGEIPPTIVVL